MTTDADLQPFFKYLRVLHRRMALQSAVDRTARLVFVAAISAIILLPLAIWGTVRPAAVVIGISIITIGAAIILAFRRWPTLADAADLADRQHSLDDLLATALRLRPVPFDDLSAVVLAIAEARCHDMRPSQIVIHRLSSKSWAGIALVAAAAITFAVLPGRWAKFSREEPSLNILADSIASTPGTDLVRSTADPRLSRSDPAGEGESAIPTPTASTGTEKNSPSDAPDQNSATSDGAANTGRGSASTKHQAAIGQLETTTGKHSSDSSGITASGSGRESTASITGDPATGTDVAAGIAGQTAKTAIAPPWQTTEWPAARAAAISAVHSGAIPPACRDLVRDYFQ